jgi:excisionase family DNA binding protein
MKPTWDDKKRPEGSDAILNRNFPTDGREGPSRRLLVLAEAAEYLGIRPRTLEKLAQTGHLPFIKLGRATRYGLGDLDVFIERNRRHNRRTT